MLFFRFFLCIGRCRCIIRVLCLFVTNVVFQFCLLVCRFLVNYSIFRRWLPWESSVDVSSMVTTVMLSWVGVYPQLVVVASRSCSQFCHLWSCLLCSYRLDNIWWVGECVWTRWFTYVSWWAFVICIHKVIWTCWCYDLVWCPWLFRWNVVHLYSRRKFQGFRVHRCYAFISDELEYNIFLALVALSLAFSVVCRSAASLHLGLKLLRGVFLIA